MILQEYFTWHYGKALKEIGELTKNFLWFGFHFFSIGLLWRTLYKPFYRIHEPLKGWTTLEMLLENIVADVMSRVIGFVIRTLAIIIGVLFEGILLLIFIPLFIAWLLVPLLTIIFLVTGLFFIFLL